MAKNRRRRRPGCPYKTEAKRYPNGSVVRPSQTQGNLGPTPEALAHGGVVGCDLTTLPGALGQLFRAGLITEDEQRVGEAFRRLVWSWRCQAGVRLPWMSSWSALSQILRTEEEIIKRWQQTTAWLRVALRALYAQPQEIRTVVGRVVLEGHPSSMSPRTGCPAGGPDDPGRLSAGRVRGIPYGPS